MIEMMNDTCWIKQYEIIDRYEFYRPLIKDYHCIWNIFNQTDRYLMQVRKFNKVLCSL